MSSDARGVPGCAPARAGRAALGCAVGLGLLLGAAGPSRAMDEEGCLNCHGLEGFAARRGGEAVTLWVSPEQYNAGIHGPLGCRECHADIASIPHPEARREVNCGLACHARGGATSHEKLYWEYTASVHGSARDRRITCLVCHPAPGAPEAQGRDKREETRRCAACHRDNPRVLAYFSDVHYVALAGGRSSAPSCPDCHTAHRVRGRASEDSTVAPRNLAGTCGSGALADSATGACHGALAARAVAGASMAPLSRAGGPGLAGWLLRLASVGMLLGLVVRAGVGFARGR